MSTISSNRSGSIQLSAIQNEAPTPSIEVSTTGKVVINGKEFKIDKLTIGTHEITSNGNPCNLNPQQIKAIQDILQETLRPLISTAQPPVDIKTVNRFNITGQSQDFDVTTDKVSVPTKVRANAEICNNLFNAFAQTSPVIPSTPTNPPTNTPTPTAPTPSPRQPTAPDTAPGTAQAKNFQSPFSLKLRNIHLVSTDLFYPHNCNFKKGKLEVTTKAIDILQKEILKLEEIKKDHKKCNELSTYLNTKLTEIEAWLNHRIKTKEAVDAIFNIHKDQLEQKIQEAEEELKGALSSPTSLEEID